MIPLPSFASKFWPYIYEGDIETEKNYLKVYAESEDAILVLAKEEDHAIGIAMGSPVKDSMEQIQKVFKENQVPMGNSYYLADLILLKEYRKRGIGLKMVQDFECAVKNLQDYEWIYFCEILRDDNDPRKPSDYRSLDSFWESFGYEMVPHWHTSIDWLEIGGGEKKSHSMRFRKKRLLPS